MTRQTNGSGDKGGRQSLGCCRSGKADPQALPESGGFQLFWMGTRVLRGTFDEALHHLIADPVPLDEGGLYWLCLLPPGDYQLTERAGGGQRLYQLDWIRNPSPRWRVVATRKGR